MLLINKTLVTVLSASVLFGCSAIEDDDEDSATTPTATESLSGKVADGYLSGAKVCLDLNSNKVCDDGEPSTTSTSGGEFTLDNVTQEQLDSAPLLVEIIVGETIDEDNAGVTIDKKYTLSAPAGYEFISPLTTMVQSEIEDSGLTPDEAEGAVQAKLGTTLDLGADFVAGKESGDDSAEFARLHKVAQVTVVVLQNNLELVEDVLGETEASFEDLVGLIVSQVLESLDDISTQVTSAGESFDPDTVAESDALDEANVDPASIEDDIAEREAARLIATADIAAVLTNNDSLHFFEADHRQSGPEFMYGSVSKGEGNAVTLTRTLYNPSTDTWATEAEESEERDHIMCILSNGAWNCVNEREETIEIVDNAIVVKNGGLDATRSEITGVSVDLTGKRIQSFLDDEEFLKVTNPKAVFAAGTTGYKLSFKRASALHAIFKNNVEDVTDCWQDGDHPANIQVGQPFNPTDTWCNNTFIRTGDGNHENDGTAATALDQLISAAAATNPSDVADIKGTSIYGRDIEIMAEFIAGGTANYYVIKHREEQSPSIEFKVVGSWKEVTVDGKVLMTYTIPPVLAEQGDIESDERIQFFTVEEGYVRRGGIEPTGEKGDNDWVFNNSGRDQILEAFDYSLLAGLSPCTSGDVGFGHDDHHEEGQTANHEEQGTAPEESEAAKSGEAPESQSEVNVSNEGATAAEFATAASNCSAVSFANDELVNTTLVTDFGFLNFKPEGAGVFLGEVGDKMNSVLDFTWTVTDGKVVINTMDNAGGSDVFLRLTLAKVAKNTRQISLVNFSQEADTAAGLDTTKGGIKGEVWGLN